MKFGEFKYERPDLDGMKSAFDDLLNQFHKAQNVEGQSKVIKQINKLRSFFDTMMNIASVRYTTDTLSEQNQAEQDFFDLNRPVFQGLKTKYYKALINSKFKNGLIKQFGQQLFDLAKVELETFHPSIVADLQKENQLTSQYTKLKSSAKIQFDGKELNLSGITPYEQSPDRETRRKASAAKWQFFENNAAEFDRIYDELVKVRHSIAAKLGYDNFVELGYKRMLRTDYNADMVANFRKQVKEVIVPIVKDLKQRQAKRLGIEQLKFYDSDFTFKSGNPTPKGDPDWIVANGKKMYEELSSETKEFFNFMLDNDLMDLTTRKGKAPGGYCTYIEDYRAPFIFSNFNGTAHDINVLTHEAGHAFQVYMSRDFDVPEYYWPTYEACEIHSMSMEFLTWPWMNSFFKEDTEKFKFEHLSGAVSFLPYGVSVDEFQHRVYENPDATPQERKTFWREIEKKYMPWVNYDGNDFLEQGSFWQRQAHIYELPFYYIDYTLAQICAFQFWKKSKENRAGALADYIKLCKAGGSKPFLQLVDYANLNSPFKDGSIAGALEPVEEYLAEVDDMVL